MPSTIDLQGLLAEDQWIRRLARQLARDAHAAEDLAQETWVAALGAPRDAPRPRALRPWLRGVLRNLWRNARAAEDARAVFEAEGVRAEAAEPASELVTELELRERVARELLALQEPYRGALYLRFFKDQSFAAIARRQGVALSSAHERVEQGLARLRERLDRSHGGRRAAWALGLVSLARPAGSWSRALEAMAMAGAVKVVAGALVLGGGVAWVLARSEPPSAGPELSAAAPSAAPSQTKPAGEVHVPPASEREPLAKSTAPAPGADALAVEPLPEPRTFRGRAVDPLGVPVAGLEVGWRGADRAHPSARSGPDGGFALPAGAGGTVGGSTVGALEPDFVTLVPALEAGLDRPSNSLLVVAPRAEAAGVVLDDARAPLAGARISFRLRDELYRSLGLHRGEWTDEPWQATSDVRGAFSLTEIAGGPRVYLLVEAPSFDPVEVELPAGGRKDLVVELRRHDGALAIRGRVFGPEGAPYAGASVSAGHDIATSDAEGRFEVHLFRGREAPPAAALPGVEGRAELVALAPGLQPARQPLAEIGPGHEASLRLGARAESIRGRVLGEDAAPVPGAVVWVRNPTRFGGEIRSIEEQMRAFCVKYVEDELAGGFQRRGVLSDEHGVFELTGLLPRTYELMAFRPATGELGGPYPFEPGSRAVELVLPRAEHRGPVAGRVRSAGGEPLEGLEITVGRGFGANPHESPPTLGQVTVRTDARGKFSLGELALEGTVLFVDGPRILGHEVALGGRSDASALELDEPLLCELVVDVAEDPDFADSLSVLDAGGRELDTIEFMGLGSATRRDTRARLSRGVSPVLLVQETAATLVLWKEGLDVVRQPVQLDPGTRTTVRP